MEKNEREIEMRWVCKALLVMMVAANCYGAPPYPKGYFPPVLSTTAIIEVIENNESKGIVLIERGKAPFGFALPGGKVEYGESVEEAVRREMREEVNLELSDLEQFHVYSDPKRDPRHHTVEVTHLAKAYSLPRAGDDAAKASLFSLEAIPWDKLAFDHAQILRDYLSYRRGEKRAMFNHQF